MLPADSVDGARLRNFNLSVLVTDEFMRALNKGAEWPLRFNGQVYGAIPARQLWSRLMRAAYDGAEPGVIFIEKPPLPSSERSYSLVPIPSSVPGGMARSRMILRAPISPSAPAPMPESFATTMQRTPETTPMPAMTAALAHRGPDADGFHHDGPLGFGHRRLSVIDLAGSRQPLLSADGAIAVVHNGEIYKIGRAHV